MKNKKLFYLVVFFYFILAKLINPLIIQKISLVNYDFYQKVLIKGEVENITIVDIDEKSLSIIGQFPWRRDAYATILDNLNQYIIQVQLHLIFFLVKRINRIQKTYLLNYRKIMKS